MDVALYWHNGRSLGHTLSSAAVAHAIKKLIPDVTLWAVTGASHGLDQLPEGTQMVGLPMFSSRDTLGGSQIVPREGSVEDLLTDRRNLLREFFANHSIDALIVDHLPWGWRNELTEVLERHHQMVKLLTWRGVLDTREATSDEYSGGGKSAWIGGVYDGISIHCDPRVFNMTHEYDFSREVTSIMRSSGYVAQPEPLSKAGARERLGVAADHRVLVATMGGGQGALQLWLELYEALRSHEIDHVRFLVGPYLEESALKLLTAITAEHPRVTLDRYVTNMSLWLRAADLVVSAAGSNAIGEVLANQCNSILIPRQLHEGEQKIHAQRLNDLGWARLVALEDCTQLRLHEAVSEALASPRTPPPSVLTSGGCRTAAHLRELVERKSSGMRH